MSNDLKTQIVTAIDAAGAKKAEDVAILQLEKDAFTDYLVICHGSNPRQVQAIADEVELRLKLDYHSLPNSTEGYQQGEWVLLDYVDFVVHVFTEQARRFRDLERLWKSAKRVTIEEIRTREMRPRRPAAAAAGLRAGKRKAGRVKSSPATKAIAKGIRSATSPRAAAKKSSKKKAVKKTGRKTK